MKISEILKQKTKEEIDETLKFYSTLQQFLRDYQITKYKRADKAFNYICRLLGDTPSNIYCIGPNDPFYRCVMLQLNDELYYNYPKQVIKIPSCSFHQAIIFKNPKGLLAAQLNSFFSINIILISKNNLNNFIW